jgi:hypothetical protein
MTPVMCSTSKEELTRCRRVRTSSGKKLGKGGNGEEREIR